MPGFASVLLKISADRSYLGQFQIDITHAASIQFGQLVDKHWRFTNENKDKHTGKEYDCVVLAEEDKLSVRENIMRAIFEQVTNKPIVKQYIRSLKMICSMDFPSKFPNLFTQIMEYLSQQNQQSIYAGLVGLYALTVRYEFELEEDREPLDEIIKGSFDKLGLLVNDMINHKDNVDALHMMHMVCKIFYSSNQLLLSPHLMEG